MAYISRDLEYRILELFHVPQKAGLILAGIVGCGKTTLIEEVLKKLEGQYKIFQWTGDDGPFRNAVHEDTRFIERHIRSQTQERALAFIDEIQKSETIFDALKYAYDHSDISFIVSGSNPDYLNTQAKKRLQRRADFLHLHPFSLPEILLHRKITTLDSAGVFPEILASCKAHQIAEKIQLNMSLRDEIGGAIDQFLTFGGLPLVYLAENESVKLNEIRKVVERGFESLSVDNEASADLIRVEMARLHSREFAYQGIFQKTGLRRRDVVNQTIDQLANHGYLVKRKPFVEKGDRRSYLSIFSYIDPGIVTYLTGTTDISTTVGQRVEGMVHARLEAIIKNQIPLKSSLHYFKPYSIDVNKKIKYKPGEIDFIFKIGSRVIPLEAKSTASMDGLDISLLKQFVQEEKAPYGIVLYKGVPHWDMPARILYWPFWLV